jgi:hypothetical protein
MIDYFLVFFAKKPRKIPNFHNNFWYYYDYKITLKLVARK